MVEIKRLNKLWSAESVHLRDVLDIPIWDPDPDTPSTSSSLISHRLQTVVLLEFRLPQQPVIKVPIVTLVLMFLM